MADSKNGVVHSVDRISELPKDILQHIQSFLPMKEVARHSVLSKTWKQVSIAPKNLEFDLTFFDTQHSCVAFIINYHNDVRTRYESKKKEDEEIQRALMQTNRRIDHVDQIPAPFGKHKLSMNKFRLEIYFFKLDWSFRFDKWIQQAIASNVQDLFVHIKLPYKPFRALQTDLDKLYSLPHCILVATSIITLEIMRCKLEFLPADFKTNLSSLKKLSLVEVYLNDYALHKIIIGCSLIEELIIKNCWGFKTLHITNDLVNLQKLIVAALLFPPEVEFVCVESLSISDIEFSGSIKKLDFHGCINLKSINLNSMTIICAIEGLEAGLNFSNLQVMGIYCCMKLKTLKIECHHLESLKIINCRNLLEIELDAPCLSEFCYSGAHVEFSWNTLVRCSVNLQLDFSSWNLQSYLELSWYSKRVEFLAKFNNRCRELTLMCFDHKELIFPNELRQRDDPPLQDLKKLTVQMSRREWDQHKEDLINCIRWLCPHSKKEYTLY